ncbi:hypothetical protein [Massilia sp. TS11]|uniref:hypothetical protein n=1 Tax=Massilia sp. TS11 TaxID=2908003 RepID=UPI001EDC8A28|nr:hypothetical protein [Massilia sp. TS11]MCG2586036.1 hypothetical protein [Massilia sp. TS11]
MNAITKTCIAAALFAATQAQAADFLKHADMAQDLIAKVAAANNVYDSDPTTVTWAGINGASIYQNRSTCAPFVSNVIKTSYGFSDSAYKTRTGSTSPSSAVYYDNITAQKGFLNISAANAIQRGDVVAIKYLPCANKTTTGHTMIAMSAAVKRSTDTAPIIAGTVQYEVQIADSSASDHYATDATGKLYSDTRGANGNNGLGGAGIGTLRLYADAASGKVVGYTWSMASGSEYFSNDSCRVIAVGRMQ